MDDRDTLYARYSDAGRAARLAGDWPGMSAAGGKLKHLHAYVEAWELMADADSLRSPPIIPDWRGEDISEETLLIERRRAHTGAELRMARFVGFAATRAHRVILATEARLVGLLARSFPEAHVVDASQTEITRQATRGASYERIGAVFGTNHGRIEGSFRPLLPPSEVLAAIRAARSSTRLVVGIAWHSSNERKSLPDHEHWAPLLQGLDAHFVSLQYRERQSGIDRLDCLSPMPIERAGGIDQIADLDAFAAQVASVDLVVSITNTTRHMAGALGKPCITVMDDKRLGDAPSPFYPDDITIQRNGRSWLQVFEDALAIGRQFQDRRID